MSSDEAEALMGFLGSLYQTTVREHLMLGPEDPTPALVLGIYYPLYELLRKGDDE